MGQPGQDGMQQTFNANPQQTMQANMPPLPNYRPMGQNDQTMASPQTFQQPQVQPQQVQANVVQPQPNINQVITNTPATATSSGQIGIVPGQDGVPINITQKGIADLERLMRLKAMGAVNDANYEAMRQKIFTTEIG